MTQGLSFVFLGAIFAILAALALLRLAMLKLESPLGRHRDGMTSGMFVPPSRLADSRGFFRPIPRGDGWQALVFLDNSVVEFPSLAAALQRLHEEEPELEMLMISQADVETTRSACELMDLDLPIVVVDDSFYKRYNVWVVPHIQLVDERGKVLVAGNVSEGAMLENMWRHARLMTIPSQSRTLS